MPEPVELISGWASKRGVVAKRTSSRDEGDTVFDIVEIRYLEVGAVFAHFGC